MRLFERGVSDMEYYLITFGISLLLTQIIEVIVLVVRKEFSKKNLILMLLTNVLTNPPAVYLSMLGDNRIWIQVPIEILVVLTEAIVYSWFAKDGWDIKNPVKLAVWANCVSWIVGLLI